MNIEIKKSQKPVKYEDALVFMEKRLFEISKKNINDLIWILEHEEVYTAGTSYSEKEIFRVKFNPDSDLYHWACINCNGMQYDY